MKQRRALRGNAGWNFSSAAKNRRGVGKDAVTV